MERMIRMPDFRRNKGLGNEVGYYVFDYPAEKEMIVRERISNVKARNFKATAGFELVVFDLYDMIIDVLKEEGFLEQWLQFEKTKDLEYIITATGHLLKIDEDDNVIVQRIKDRTPQEAVVILIGVGKCYPLLRSHKALNTLHQAVDHVPVVMFYPGKYDGLELILFGELKDDNYYRAFRLAD
jgi:hypothetical protein